MLFTKVIATITLGSFITSCSVNVQQADGSMKKVWPRSKEESKAMSARSERQKALEAHADQVVLAKLQEFEKLRTDGASEKSSKSADTERDFEEVMARYENGNPLTKLHRNPGASQQASNKIADSDVDRFVASILVPIRECKKDHQRWSSVYPALANQVRVMEREYKISVINEMVKAEVPFLNGEMGEITRKTFTQADFDEYQERLAGSKLMEGFQTAVIVGTLDFAGKMIGGTVANIADGFRHLNDSGSTTSSSSASISKGSVFKQRYAGSYTDFTVTYDGMGPENLILGQGEHNYLVLRSASGDTFSVRYSGALQSGNGSNKPTLEGTTINVRFSGSGEPCWLKNISNGQTAEVSSWGLR